MIETVQLSRRRAALILFRSLKAMGYPDLLARQAVWSALWLEDREIKGAYLLSGFLDYTQNLTYAQRAPSPNRHGETVCPCPFLVANAVIGESERLQTTCLTFCAPVVPILMLPGLTDWFARDKKLVRLRYKGMPFTGLPSAVAFPPDRKTFEAFCLDLNETMEVDLLPSRKELRRGKPGRARRVGMPAEHLDGSKALTFCRKHRS